MDFTREPVVESVIIARDGFKLSVKPCYGSSDQEEYLVKAVEVVRIGSVSFLRSVEGVIFLLPPSIYKVVEVREPSLNLKKSSQDKQGRVRSRVRKNGYGVSSSRKHQNGDTGDVTENSVKKVSVIEPPETLVSDQIDKYKRERDQDSVIEDPDDA